MTSFVDILKATRINRTLSVLMVILVSAAFVNTINKEIIILILCCILVYSVFGIHNAIRDRDYLVPLYSKKVMLALLAVAVIVSLLDYVIFFTVLTWIFLGYIYNTVARYVLFGDATILSITHFALPSLSSSLLLGINKMFALTLVGFMFFTFWFVMHLKNLKDTIGDKKRGYRTLTTVFKNGKTMTILSLGFSFIPMLFAYLLFNLTIIYFLILFLVFVLGLIIIFNILRNKEDLALKLARGMVMLFLFGLIAGKAVDIKFVLFALSLCSVYGLFLIADIFKHLGVNPEVRYYATKQD